MLRRTVRNSPSRSVTSRWIRSSSIFGERPFWASGWVIASSSLANSRLRANCLRRLAISAISCLRCLACRLENRDLGFELPLARRVGGLLVRSCAGAPASGPHRGPRRPCRSVPPRAARPSPAAYNGASGHRGRLPWPRYCRSAPGCRPFPRCRPRRTRISAMMPPSRFWMIWGLAGGHDLSLTSGNFVQDGQFGPEREGDEKEERHDRQDIGEAMPPPPDRGVDIGHEVYVLVASRHPDLVLLPHPRGCSRKRQYPYCRMRHPANPARPGSDLASTRSTPRPSGRRPRSFRCRR